VEEFLVGLRRIIKTWPETARWSIGQISSYTGSQEEDVMKWVSSILQKSMDLQSTMTIDEGEMVADALAGLLETGERLPELRDNLVQKAMDEFKKLKPRLNNMTQKGDWRQAYKSLNYQLGINGQSLPLSLRLELFGDCLRFGQKADISDKELFRYLRFAVLESMEDGTQGGIEEALDFIDAYGEIFIKGPCQSSLVELLEQCSDPAAAYQMMDKYNELRTELGLV